MSLQQPPNLASTTSLTAPVVLLRYQQDWIADDSPLKVSEKSRRTGLTWAEASDDVLIAAARDGQNVYYIGYNQDMALEYIEACAMWARAYNEVASEIEEGLWEDGEDDRDIKTYTIKFPSGRRIVALSSRPANLRGKQGVVVIDEAAFHDKLGELLKAAMALLIWGGKVRVISTHNGDSNLFNELIQDIRAGRRNGTVQRITFKAAVEQGLYRRVCLRLGKAWTAEGEANWVDSVYAFYGEDASEELDVIPSAGSGAWLSRAAIEAVMDPEVPVLRLSLPDGFAQESAHIREAEVREWCEEKLRPLLDQLDENMRHFLGEDFGRTGDLSVFWPLAQTQGLGHRTPFVVELRRVPFEQQKQILFYIVDRLPRFAGAALDATGNGAYLAEVAMQRYGSSRVEEVKLSVEWYRQHMPRVKADVEDRTVNLPKDADIMADLRAVRVLNGVAQVPRDARVRGGDGQTRHGDSAIALPLAVYAATAMEGVEIEYASTGVQRSSLATAGFVEERRGTEHGQAAGHGAGWGSVAGGVDTGGF